MNETNKYLKYLEKLTKQYGEEKSDDSEYLKKCRNNLAELTRQIRKKISAN